MLFNYTIGMLISQVEIMANLFPNIFLSDFPIAPLCTVRRSVTWDAAWCPTRKIPGNQGQNSMKIMGTFQPVSIFPRKPIQWTKLMVVSFFVSGFCQSVTSWFVAIDWYKLRISLTLLSGAICQLAYLRGRTFYNSWPYELYLTWWVVCRWYVGG